MAFDAPSGSLHLLDEPSWCFLQHFTATRSWESARRRTAASFGEEVAEEVAAEAALLMQEGRLFARDSWQDWVPGPELGLKALCLNVSHACNMSCGYCFVPSRVRGEESFMGRSVVKAAIDFLLATTPYTHLALDFFGGEPLLNFEAVQWAVEYALSAGKEKEWKFTLTTNTLLLDEEVLAFCREHDFCLVLSCDGRPEVHDRYRRLPRGGGTAEHVHRRLREFLERGGTREYYIRGTYTRANLDFAADFCFLARLGARVVSLEPVVAGKEPFALRPEDLPRVREEYFRLARLLLELGEAGREVSFYHFCLDLTGGPCVAKRLTGCGAGYQYLAVTPAGELYPCHQFVGHREYLMGDVWRGVVRRDLEEEFRSAHIYRKEPCRACWARFLCGGGCHAQAALHEGSLLRPHPLSCELVKARLEAALYYLACSHLQGGGEGT